MFTDQARHSSHSRLLFAGGVFMVAALVLLCIQSSALAVQTTSPTEGAVQGASAKQGQTSATAQGEQPKSPQTLSEFFLLTYPISSKWAVYYNPSGHPRYLDYTSIVDHTPPFYQVYSTLDVWTGESGATSGSGGNACGALDPPYRDYCYNGHSGLDMPVTYNTPIRASHAGIVIRGAETQTHDGGYGWTVFIRDETNPMFITRYSHLYTNTIQVSAGMHVARGQLIAQSGCTGTGCGGPHLHWGLYYDSTWNSRPHDLAGQVLDPYGWMSLRANPIGTPTTNEWAGGYSSQGATHEPPTINLNEGTVQGPEYIDKNFTAYDPHVIGAAGVDAIEQWWTNNYGAAGPPITDRYYNYQYSGYCQDFEGGRYCPSGYTPWSFSDAPITYWAHRYVEWAAREGVVSGYSDGTFRPSNFVTRGQMAKIIVNGFNIPLNTSGGPYFADVPYGSTFYDFVETARNNNIIAGYNGDSSHWNQCTVPAGYENPNLHYFRWCEDVRRGQMTKFVAQGLIVKGKITGLDTTNVGTHPGADYWDVLKTDAFFQHIRTLYNIGAIRYHHADGDTTCQSFFSQATCQNMGHFYVGWQATRAQVVQLIHEAVYSIRPTNR